MALFKRRASAPITVLGLGGGGCSAVRHMAREPIPGCRYILCDSDDVPLHGLPAGVVPIPIDQRIILPGFTRNRWRVTKKFRSVLGEALQGAETVLIATGMGGVGYKAGPMVAEVARESGALVVGILTTPFKYEADRRLWWALRGIENLRAKVDNIIIIDNRRLHWIEDPRLGFVVVDEAVSRTVRAVCRLLNVPGWNHVDRDKVKAILRMHGGALPAIGDGDQDSSNPALEASAWATNRPLLDLPLSGAKGVLVNVEGGPDLTLEQVSEAASHVAAEVHPGASMVIGIAPPDARLSGTARLTVLATGIGELLPWDWVRFMEEYNQRRVV